MFARTDDETFLGALSWHGRARSAPPPPAAEPPHPLEAALVAAPDELPRYREWAAHLRASGDVRGELIDLQVALFEARRRHVLELLGEHDLAWLGALAEALDMSPAELYGRGLFVGGMPMDLTLAMRRSPPGTEAKWSRAHEIIERHRFAWLGGCGRAQLKWKLGYLHTVEIADQAGPALSAWRHIAAQPMGRLVRGLTFAVPSPQELVDGLVATPLPSPVSRLHLGHGAGGARGDTLALEPLYARVPHLRALFIALRHRLELGRVQLPALQHLHLVNELSGRNVRAVAEADWPSLKRLVLDLRPAREGAKLEDLLPLWGGGRTPRLVVLGLQGAPFVDALPAALAASSLMPQLRLLDLAPHAGAGGRLTDAGAQALLRHASAFAHLDHLNLGPTRVSAPLQARLRGLCRSVDVASADDEFSFASLLRRR
jgi:hypothetical protein